MRSSGFLIFLFSSLLPVLSCVLLLLLSCFLLLLVVPLLLLVLLLVVVLVVPLLLFSLAFSCDPLASCFWFFRSWRDSF